METLPKGNNLIQSQNQRQRIRFSIRTSLAILILFLTTACVSSNSYPIRTGVIEETKINGEESDTNRLSKLSFEQLLLKGNAYLQNGNLQLAKLHYQKAIDIQPKSATATIGLGKAFYREGKIDNAAELFESSLKLEPDNVKALTLLGITARQQGDIKKSLEVLTRAYDLDSNNPQVLTELAITNDHLGERLSYSESLYQKVTELLSNSAAAHNNLGFNYLLQGRHQDAIKALSRALVLAPENFRARNNLGAAYLLDDQPEKALRLFQSTVGLAAAYNNLGYIQMTRGNYSSAEKAFKKALQINPSFYVRAQQNLDSLEQTNRDF